MTRNMDISRRAVGGGDLESALMLPELEHVTKPMVHSPGAAGNAANLTLMPLQCDQSVGFAQHSHRKLNLKGGVQQRDAVYTALPTLPEGAVKTDAHGAVTAPFAKRNFDAVRTYG